MLAKVSPLAVILQILQDSSCPARLGYDLIGVSNQLHTLNTKLIQCFRLLQIETWIWYGVVWGDWRMKHTQPLPDNSVWGQTLITDSHIVSKHKMLQFHCIYSITELWLCLPISLRIYQTVMPAFGLLSLSRHWLTGSQWDVVTPTAGGLETLPVGQFA